MVYLVKFYFHMKNLFLSLLIIGCSNVFSQSKRDYSFAYSTDSIISTAFGYYQKEQYSNAITEFKKIAKTDPKYLVAQYEIALALFSDNKKEELLNHLVENEPVLTQISVAKRLRDRAEREARIAGLTRVTEELIQKIKASAGAGISA